MGEMSENLRRNLLKWHALRKVEEQNKAMQQVQTMSDELLTLTQQAQARERAQRPRDIKGHSEPSSPTGTSNNLLRATADYSSSPPGSPAALEVETPSLMEIIASSLPRLRSIMDSLFLHAC